ncbi:PREDICTED: microtubule-associated protein futsch-like [Branchiostoma belcheri]|uniref:Microtubule-associated protein futsch-like n=1 Tax=Branchiostoma belcheri TaxID=7741 RepID=A0A6P4YQK0_BRABE|nr:PREDICTED: microtubule-associated protein futsch-like [Branchiostoma belcheri]XP_019626669.1 PREDICTED: microtubule-associated protein futsch-like [Branchiostoma belcheri]
MATVERLNLPQRTGSAQGYFVMPKTWTSHLGSPARGSDVSLPEWMNYSLDTKMPLIPGIEKAMVLYTTNLGERLHARPDDHDFDLTDPCGHQMSTEYSLLHDPHLKPFYSSPRVKHRLVKNGFITEDGKVLCTLKEFNQYRQYLRKISLDHYRNERRRQLEDAVLARERAVLKKKEDKAQTESLQIIKSRRDKAKETRQKLAEQEEAARRRYMTMMRKDATKRNLLQMEKTLNQEKNRKEKEKEWENQRFKFQLKQDKDRRRRKKMMESWKVEEKERQRRLDERRRQEQREKEAKTMEHFVEHARLRALQREEMLRVEEEERLRRQENIRAREAAIQAQRQKQYETFLKRKQRQQERRERTQKTLLQMWRDKTKADQSGGKADGSGGGRTGLFSRFMGVTEGAEPAKGEAEKKGLDLGRLVDRAIDKAMEDFETPPSLPPGEQSEEPAHRSVEEIAASIKEPQETPVTKKTVKRKFGTKGKKRSIKFKVTKDSMARLKNEFHGAQMIDMDEMERQEEEKTRQADLLIRQLQTDFPGANVSLEDDDDDEEEEVLEEVELQQVLSRSETTLLHMRAAEIVRAVMETVSKVIIPRMLSEMDIIKQTAREFVPWVIGGVQQELRRSDSRVLSRVASDMVTSALEKLQTEMTEDVQDGGTHRASRAASQLVSSVIDGVRKEFSNEDMVQGRTKEVRTSTSDSSLLSQTARDIVAYVTDSVTKELTGQRADGMSAMSATKSCSDTSVISRTARQVVSSVENIAKTASKVEPALSESETVREMASQITSWVLERVRQEMADGSSEASAESFDDSCLERELLRTMRADSTPVDEPYSRPLSPEPSSDVEISRAGSKQSTVSKPKVSKSRKPSKSEITSRRVSMESVGVSARASPSKDAMPSTSSSSHKVRLLALTSRTSVKTSPVTSTTRPSPKTSRSKAMSTRKLSRTSRESVTSQSKKSKSDSVVKRSSNKITSTSLSSHAMSPTASKSFQQRSNESFRSSKKTSSPSVRRSSSKVSSTVDDKVTAASTADKSDAGSTDRPAEAAPPKDGTISPKKFVSATQASSEHKEPVQKTSLQLEHQSSRVSPKSPASEVIQPSTQTQMGKASGQTSSDSNSSGRRASISAPGIDVRRSSLKSLKETPVRGRSSGVVVRSGPSMSGSDVRGIQEKREELESTGSKQRVVKTAPSTPLPEDDAGESVMPSSHSEGSVKARTSVNKVSSTPSAWSAPPSKKTSSRSLTKTRDSQSDLTSPSGTNVSARKSTSKPTSQTGIATSQLGSSSRTPSFEKTPSKSSIKASSSKSTSKVTTTSRSSSSSLRKTKSGAPKGIATPASEAKSGTSVRSSRSGGSKASLVKNTKSFSNVKPSQSKSKDSIKDKAEIKVESNTSRQECEEIKQPGEMEGDLDEDLHLDDDEGRDFEGDTEEPSAKDMQLLGRETEMSDVSDAEDEEVLTETENVVIKKRKESLVGSGPEEEPTTMRGSRASMKSYRRHSIAGSCATMEVDRSECAPLAPTMQGRTVDLDDDLRENLSAISVKASYQDRMQDEITPRNSFRCLQRPELSNTQGLEREESLRSLITKRRMSMPSGATLASFRAENSSEDIVQVNTMFDVGEFSRGVRRYSEVPRKPEGTYRPEVDSSASLEKILETKEKP